MVGCQCIVTVTQTLGLVINVVNNAPEENQFTGDTPVRGRDRLLNLVEILLVLSGVCVVASFFARFLFLFDLAAHFRVHCMAALIVGGIVLAVFRNRRGGLAAVGLGLILLITLFPYLLPRTSESGLKTYRLMAMNVLTQNQRHEEVINYIRQQQPDMVVLLEVSHQWQSTFEKGLGEDYRYRLFQPQADNFGIGLLSRQRWQSAEIRQMGEMFLPVVDATFMLDGDTALRLFGMHPVPPTSHLNWVSRNEQFDEVARDVASNALGDTTIVAGDLNCTPWSPFFNRFIRMAGLSDSSLGRGIRSTWYPLPFLVTSLPIDHVCVGRNIVVQSRTVGPHLGLDHHPVLVDFFVLDDPSEGKGDG